ncbi:NHS-like protein 1 isoform X3 [Anabas testudineus]|uniref:NHS-like protein 1 isoform X3 n=1 Tax=Anabas testudineus TaxID=64144 RepID=UPI000E461A5D|nr:NHS-like protein 1 isoform X3 [Anabas testudineus]
MLCLKAGDGDSKWSVRYTTQKPQQGLIFVPAKRRLSSADDVQGNGLTQHGPASSHLHLQSPTSSPSSSGLDQLEGSTCSGWKNKSRKMQSSASSDEDERFILNNKRPLTPLVLSSVHVTSSLDVFAPSYEQTVDMEVEPIPRLPTPEERMRQEAEAVGADIVPINVTGESFDRQASSRRTLSSSDSLSRRPRNLSRRKTVTGISDVGWKLDSPLSLPDQSSTVGHAASSCTSTDQQKTMWEELEERERAEIRKEDQSSVRRIRAPEGEGMTGLMASPTRSAYVESCQEHSSSCCSPPSEARSLPRLVTNSSLNSEASCNSTPYRTLSASSSSCQGFPSDIMPLLPFDPKAKVIPQSPFSSSSSLSSSPVTSSSLPSTPSRVLQSECSYPSDKPLNESAQRHSSTSSSHYVSSSSIADSESQFSYQALDDHNTQFPYDGGSCSEERWSYQPLSHSSSLHSSQTGSDWNSITREMSCVSGEGWSCDPLLSSGRSSPAFTDSNSLFSENITSSSLLNWEKKKCSPASSYSHTIIRNISLRKSKRPPPPPLRSDSLRCRPGRSKSSRSSSSPRLERTIQQTPNPSPQTFHDPWVPRNDTKRRQSGLNCGTVTTFEPLSPDCHAPTLVESPAYEHFPQIPSHSHAHVFTPGSPGSEALSFTLNPQSATSSVAGLQRLASPSSGYSSQSNTPTPGTPVSSPLTPSSPLTESPGAFYLPLTSPLSSSHSYSFSLSPGISSLPRTRSEGERRPKPPVPERKSSLLSSLSSSFSSISSLSSCTSSEHPVLPAPPPPPPLPHCSSSSFSVFTSPIRAPLPPAPPLPLSYLPAPPSFSKLSAAPFRSPSSHPSPPPPPPLPPSPVPVPSPLQLSSRPPPPPYSYAIRQTSLHALESTESQSNVFPPHPSSDIPEVSFTNLPPPPPPPPLPSLPTSSVVPLSFANPAKSLNPCVRVVTSPFPLVTTQALQGVKLRSIKNQEALSANNMLAGATPHGQASTLSANAKHADTIYDFNSKEAQPDCSELTNANVNPNTDGPGSQNAVCTLDRCGNDNPAKQPVIKSDHDYYNLTKNEVRTPTDETAYAGLQSLQGSIYSPDNQRTSGHQVVNSKDNKFNEQVRKESDTYASLTNNQISSPDSSWIKISSGNDQNHINPLIQEQQITDTVLADNMLSEPAETSGNTENDSSYWTLSGTNQVYPRESRRILLESKDEEEGNGKDNSADESPMAYSDVTQSELVLKSPEKPTPLKKPDLCILGLKASTEDNTSLGGSPQKQKPPILHKKPDLSLTSTRKIKTLFPSENTSEAPNSNSVAYGTLEIAGISHTQNTTGIVHIIDPRNKFNGIMSTLENCVSSGSCCTMENSNFGSKGTKMWTCVSSGTMGPTQAWSTCGVTNTTDGTMKNCGTTQTCRNEGNSGDHGGATAETRGTPSGATDPRRLYKDNQKTFHKRMMRPSLAEDEEEDDEDEKVKERGTKTMMMSSSTKKRGRARRRRRRRRTGRQLLIMSSTMQPTPSSSSSSSSSSLSSSSSSSGDEQDLEKGRTVPTRERVRMSREVWNEETDSESSCAQTGHSRNSLSSALSTESLQGELSLPDLLIQEPGEEEEEKRSKGEAQSTEVKAKETREPPDGDLFVSVSADQMFVSGRPRTTEDLFAVIHRSKRKMLGRRHSEENGHCIVSSSWSSSADPVPCSTQPVAFKTQRSSRSESFKALLLRKGSRSDSCSRISAVERLCTDLQHVPSLLPPPEQTQVKPTSLFHTVHRQDVPLSPTSLCSQNLFVKLGLKQRDLMSTQLFFFSASMRPRSLTPPCSASRRFAARSRLVAAPMTAIFEGEGEEEEEEDDNDEGSIESPGIKEESSQRLEETS